MLLRGEAHTQSYSYSAKETYLLLLIKLITVGYFIKSSNCQNYSPTSRCLQDVVIMTLDRTYDHHRFCYFFSWLCEWFNTGPCTKLLKRPKLSIMSKDREKKVKSTQNG